MKTRSWASLARGAAVIALFMILGAHGMLPTPASAQTGGSTTLPGGGSLMVSISSPVGGTTVTGTITVAATVSTVGSVTVQGVQFKLDGVNLGAQDTTAPYSVAWNTAGVGDGSHMLTAVARDAAGNTTTSAAVAVTVDKTPPTVAITAPAANASVSATVTVTASASDTDGVLGVQFQLAGVN